LGVVAARAVFATGRVTFHRIIGGILLYLNIGSIFVALIGFVALIDPNVLTNLQPLEENYPKYIYFSFTTLTTTGYGDIIPVHPYARSLANIEQIIGQLYPAVLIARLVTLEIVSRHES
jgi:voltage-gated potassium channel Kch